MTDFARYADAQMSVLGAVLIDDRCAPLVMSRTRESDYVSSYLTIFRAMKQLFSVGKPIDPVTLLGVLSQDYIPMLRQLMEVTPTAANVAEYIDLLLECSVAVRVRELAETLVEQRDMEDIKATVSEINRVLGDRPSVQILNMANGMADFFQRQKAAPNFMPWGLGKLDETVMTELGGDFNVLGGYPSSGKTALSLQMAWEQARSLRVGYFSLETKPEKVIDRAVAMATGVDFRRIKRHQLEDDDWRLCGTCMKDMADRKLEVIKAGGLTVAEIQALAIAGRYQVIYIDYLQLIRGGNPRDTDFSRVTQISMDLHTMAQNCGITIVALSQLARPANEKGAVKAPTMHSLRQSGQIEQDADAIMLLYRENDKDPKSRRCLKIAKNKEGEAGGILMLEFHGATQRFTPVVNQSKEVAGALARQGRAAKRVNQAKQTDMFSDLEPDTELPPEFEEESQC